MADHQIGNIHGYAAKAVGSGNEKTNLTGDSDGNPRTAHFDADQADIAAMRARLTAINGTAYTSAVLDAMTTNDMAYAIRLADHPNTI